MAETRAHVRNRFFITDFLCEQFQNCFVSAKTAVTVLAVLANHKPVSVVYAKLLSMMLSNFSQQAWRSYALLDSVKSN